MPRKLPWRTTLTIPGMSLIEDFVDTFELCTERRRTHHTTVQHARNVKVLHIGELAGQLAGNVEPLDGLAYDFVVGWIFRRSCGIELEREIFSPDQFGIS